VAWSTAEGAAPEAGATAVATFTSKDLPCQRKNPAASASAARIAAPMTTPVRRADESPEASRESRSIRS